MGTASHGKSHGNSGHVGHEEEGSAKAKTTVDHEEIRAWAEARGGKPAHVRRTGGKGDPGILRIDFPGYSGEGTLESISWDDWFEAFDENGLAFLYQEHTAAGEESRFNKLVSRETVEARAHGDSKASVHQKRDQQHEHKREHGPSRPSHP
jgi:hypothetical protein